MKSRRLLFLLVLICLLLVACRLPRGVPGPVPTAPLEETPRSDLSETAAADLPAPTNTRVVEEAAAGTPIPQPTPQGAGTPKPPIPTAVVAPELVALALYSQGLQEELLEPVAEMAATLDELMPDGRPPDVVTFCTGVQVVLDTLGEVQQGLDELGPPPSGDADLQECWVELNAAVDDLEQGVLLVDSCCETFNLAVLQAAAGPLQGGAQHLENASLAFERWQARMGL